MKNKTAQNVLVSIGTLVTIVFNFLATTLPLNGISTKELSDSFHVYFVPAAYVFSIWGVIYVGMIGIALYYWLRNNTHKQDIFLTKLFPYHMLGLLMNCFWLIAWHYRIVGLSVVIMLILLISLIMMFLEIMKFKVNNPEYLTSRRYIWLLQIPVSIYLGWISVATIANITAFLDSIGVKQFIISGQWWAALLCVVAGILAAIMLIKYRSMPYAIVIIWAVTGIMVKFTNQYEIMIGFAVTILIIMAAVIYTLFQKKAQ